MAGFDDMVSAERERITKLIDGVNDKIKALNTEIAGYKRQLLGLDAYERATSATPVPGTRSKRGAKQETLHGLIAGFPDGLSRGEILEELGLKGNKAQEGAISNALNNMKKKGVLVSEGGKYLAV